MVKPTALVPVLLPATVVALPRWSAWGGGSSGHPSSWGGGGSSSFGPTSSGHGSGSSSSDSPSSSSVTTSSSGSYSTATSTAANSSSSSSASPSNDTSRLSAPVGSITVCSSGCDFITIQSAVNSLGSSDASIYISAGVYPEQVTIPSLNGSLVIYGETADTSSYSGNTVSIEHSASLASGAADDEHTGTLIIESDNVAVYNIDIKNTYGEGSQAIALSAYGNNQGYYGVGFYSYQDTLLAETGNQVYASCYIEGAVDFIFGQYARAWIVGTTIASIGYGAITANGRADDDEDGSYYVITDSTITAGPGAPDAGTVYLGRPWFHYARVAFQNTAMSDIVNPAGWQVWSTNDTDTSNVVFQEYGNTGDGALGTRASFETDLSSAITIDTILGSNYTDWVDADYI